MRRSLKASLFSIAAVCLMTSGPAAHAGVAQYRADIRAMAAPVGPVAQAPEAVVIETTLPRPKKVARKVTYIYACGITKRAIAGFLIVPLPPEEEPAPASDTQSTALYDRTEPVVTVAAKSPGPLAYEVCSIDAGDANGVAIATAQNPVDEEYPAAVEKAAFVDAPVVDTQETANAATAANDRWAAAIKKMASITAPVVDAQDAKEGMTPVGEGLADAAEEISTAGSILAEADAQDAEDDVTPVDEDLVAAAEDMASVDADPASPSEDDLTAQTNDIEQTPDAAINAAALTEDGLADNSVPVVINRSVESFIKYFQGRGRKHFVKWLSRSPEYMGMLQGILRENGLPEDIFYIALIESGLNPKAKSHARAVGMWQFIKGTGKNFGLRIDWWIDERMDPEKATVAAAKYFKNLYGEFGSWYLAAAGYNAGEGRVRRAVRKHRTSDFWELASHKKPLRRETREYVPKYLAAMLIAKDPQAYGFDADELSSPEPIAYEKVNVPTPTDLHIIAEACGSTPNEIKKLNPELLRWFTPPNYPDYEVKIPAGTKDTFIENFAKVPPQERLVYHMHKIKRGDTLSQIARRYGTDVKAIQKINNLKSVRLLRIGSTIAIPVPPDIGERKRLRSAHSDGRSA